MAGANATATQRRITQDLVTGNGIAYKTTQLVATAEFAVASTTGFYINFGYIPSNARILPSSRLYNDDLATTGSPTLALGLFAVDSNITSDDDCIGDGHDLATASTTGKQVLGDIANAGLPAWDFVNGQASDPGGSFLVRGTLEGAGTTQAGTVTLDLHYVVD